MNKYIKTFGIIFFLVIIDQIVKKIIVSTFTLGEVKEVIHNFFDLTLLQNKGAAFSILEGKVIFLILFSLIIIIYLINLIIKDNNLGKFSLISYILIIGGATGNLIDRIVHGYVIDYLAFYPFGYAFPVFNLADTFVVSGVILLCLSSIRGNKDEISNK